MEHLTRDNCLWLLKNKYAELILKGENRLPTRADFSDSEVSYIKSYFGPFPRALEEAGIKEKRTDDRTKRNREKRLRAKKRRADERKKETKQDDEGK